MTVASFVGVMATVFRIRWVLTVSFLELAVRVMLLSALFTRSGGKRDARQLVLASLPYAPNPQPERKTG